MMEVDVYVEAIVSERHGQVELISSYFCHSVIENAFTVLRERHRRPDKNLRLCLKDSGAILIIKERRQLMPANSVFPCSIPRVVG